jgi:hypothetical protein
MSADRVDKKVVGVLAEFASPGDLYHACEKVRDAGFKHWDAHSPFPVHGIEKAMGLPRSKLPWVVFLFAMAGAGGGFLLQYWTNAIDYPLVISGKPHVSWPAWIPVTFELGVLFGAVGALFGMLHFNRLPRLHHPLFSSDRFARATDDAFFISIEAEDGRFKAGETPEWLRSLGAVHVEVLEA